MASLEMPTCENVTRTETTWEADLVFDAEAPCFRGHFPGFPVLPGVVQLGVARAYAACFVDSAVSMASVKKMKFSGVVVPGVRVHLTLTRRGGGEVGYEYRKGDAVCSSGVLCF